MSGKYSAEVQEMGPEASESKTLRVLNRVLASEMRGITIEADAKHANLHVQAHGAGGRGLTPPCAREADRPDEVFAVESPGMSAGRASQYRAAASRDNYLGAGRPVQ